MYTVHCGFLWSGFIRKSRATIKVGLRVDKENMVKNLTFRKDKFRLISILSMIIAKLFLAPIFY